MLIKQEIVPVYDISTLACGMLMYAKHKSWTKGEQGFLTHVDENLLIVQYHPGIGNVTNHFKIPVLEVMQGEWEIRWSEDLSTVYTYPVQEEGETGTEESGQQI